MKFDPRQAWLRLGTPGKVAAAASLLAFVVLCSIVPAFVRALLAPSAETQSSAAGDKELAAKVKEKFPGYLAQIEGRSLFLKPGPPKQESKQPDAPQPEDVTPQKPTTYGGPAVVAMMGDSVWFDNGKRMQVGDKKEGDIRVVAVNIPWEATIEWQEVEFKVGLFKKDDLVIKDQPKEEHKPSSKDAPAASDEGDAEGASAKPPAGDANSTPKVAVGDAKDDAGSPEKAKPAGAPATPAPSTSPVPPPATEPAKPGSS